MSEVLAAVPDPPPAPEGFEATAAWVGAQVWVARRLFEVVGGWSADEADAEARVWFATVSRHVGWHAELLAELLPETVEHRPEPLVVEPEGGWGVVLAELALETGTVARLAGLVRVVLTHLITALDAMAARTTPAAGGPLHRVLALVGRDQRDDQRAGEALLERLLGRVGPDAVRIATDQQRALETTLLLPLDVLERDDDRG
ncbi:MAG: hypothetical protein R2726_23320 [Acidimicrobiales bacterium]